MADPYATHIPVLTAIGHSLPICRILELGCGLYSTPLFCNPAVFPFVRVVDSYENHEEWISQIGSIVKSAVLNLHPVKGDIVLPDLESYDLVFVDNGLSAKERSRTIAQVSLANPVNPLIVIHDFEVGDYQKAADFHNILVHRDQTPNTAVAWNHSCPFGQGDYLEKYLKFEKFR